jgi:branched-chain amino acid transport system substrate-binding protein
MGAERQPEQLHRPLRLRERRGLQRCGDNLTRENLLAQATSFNKERVGMLLPGIELTNSNENYAPYRSLRMAIFEKTSWKLLEE